MLSALIQRFSLPLLAKDLVETANRRRTYALRVVYALLLYSAALLMYVSSTDAYSKTGLQLLGTGNQLLSITFGLQCFGICLFMPALSVGAITLEKEKNTLTLLFLTRLGPWTILFEKYLARCIHMASYLLISLPLFGIAYSLGGVTQLEVWSAIWTLLVFTAQVGAICMACSAFFQSTAGAFIWAYLIGAGLYFLPLMYYEIMGNDFYQQFISILETVINDSAGRLHVVVTSTLAPLLPSIGWGPVEISYFQRYKPISLQDSDLPLMFFPLNLMLSTFWNRPAPFGPSFWHVLFRTIPIAFTIGVCLLLARVWLVSRVAVIGSSRLMRALRSLDGFFHRINQNSWTKGRVLIRDSATLPLEKPIAWRETTKRAFGTFRYLVRMLILIEVPVAVICLFVLIISINGGSYWNRSQEMVGMSFLLWILSLLFLISKAATALPSERLRETFDVLLSTPMSTREIVQQKFAGVNRLIWVLSIPLTTVIIAHALWIDAAGKPFWSNQGVGWYLLGSTAAILIYPRMIAWLSILVSLAIKSQTKAIFSVLAIVLAWCILPVACMAILEEVYEARIFNNFAIGGLLIAQSPAMLVGAVETAEFRETGVIVVVSILEYLAITITLREICLRAAARMLGRPETQ